MASIGYYREELQKGRFLTVSADSWGIEYVKSGYYGDKISFVSQTKIEALIEALPNVWQQFQDLRTNSSIDGATSVKLKDGITLKINGKKDGIMVTNNRSLLTSETEVNEFFQCYCYAQQRAEQVQKLLSEL